jgi:ribonuclease VapC
VSVILDASALLALLGDESGADLVATAIAEGASIGAVNLAEVASTLTGFGMPATEVREVLSGLVLRVLDFDEDLAHRVAALLPITRTHGLSLGDRACLALGQREGLPVLTADRAWAGLDLGLEVRSVR